MKIYITSIFAALLIFFSSMDEPADSANRFAQAPDFKVENSFRSLSSGDLKGKYVILSFWSPKDTASRIRNSRLAKEIAAQTPEGVRLVSVNTDSDAALAASVLGIDGVSAKNQFNLYDLENSRALFADWSVASGNRVFLINPEGRIERINPSEAELDALLEGSYSSPRFNS